MLIHKQVIYSLRHPASNKHWLQAHDITLIFKLQSSQAWLVYTEGSLHPLSSLSASKNASSVSNLIPAAEHCLLTTPHNHRAGSLCLWLRHRSARPQLHLMDPTWSGSVWCYPALSGWRHQQTLILSSIKLKILLSLHRTK